ncbi:Eco57I restriction-modification methylase domain-containing protein [Parasaccharibacter sp. TMW2.1882]|nr:hypothetical protein [Parasaccharibacter sp. TMW2.1882]
MTELLGDVNGLNILEPSVGNGSLLSNLKGMPSSIDAIDIDQSLLSMTKKKFHYLPIYTYHEDFINLFIYKNNLSTIKYDYDAVISNPPFGLNLSKDVRAKIKSLFPYMYARESYGLFFVFSLMSIKNGARYVFLLPDTFLTSKNHTPLRRFINTHGDPTHIVRFPSKRFKTVNFGYANLCIIAGYKRPITHSSKLKWIEAFDNHSPLLKQSDDAVWEIPGINLEKNVNDGWYANITSAHSEIKNWDTLGQIAECKTGIYTGDNRQFIGYDVERITKRLNGHPIQWQDVYQGEMSQQQKECGLDSQKAYVPFIRGGHRNFDDKTAWAIRWDKEALHFYKNNKKARLQNLAYYFRNGLAVPMVTSRRLSASLMSNSIFDQGVVGVFPVSSLYHEALLLYLNSSLATKLRNQLVNGSANNSANYLKRLPIPHFQKSDCENAKFIVNESLKKGVLSIETCDSFINYVITNQDI